MTRKKGTPVEKYVWSWFHLIEFRVTRLAEASNWRTETNLDLHRCFLLSFSWFLRHTASSRGLRVFPSLAGRHSAAKNDGRSIYKRQPLTFSARLTSPRCGRETETKMKKKKKQKQKQRREVKWALRETNQVTHIGWETRLIEVYVLEHYEKN